MPDAPLLAVVVPAYKRDFLEQALASLAAQTDQRFHLYVFDDASPADLEEIYRRVFPGEHPARRFVRFGENLGGRSLVQQWNRCVERTGGEPWVWLFSDDDVADHHCVANFYAALQADAAGGQHPLVYRFNTVTIDAAGAVLSLSPPHPEWEDELHFIYHRMRYQRNSYAPDYLFAREAFDRCGGFVEFPFALGSDDASWIAFSGGRPMRTINGAYVYFRLSGSNTSVVRSDQAVEKVLAFFEVAQWMHGRVGKRTIPLGQAPGGVDIHDAIRQWSRWTIHSLPQRLPLRAVERLAARLHGREGLTKNGVRLRLLRSNGQVLMRQAARWAKSWLE